MASDRNTSIRSSQILKHTIQLDDLSPDALVWQEPVIDKDLTTPPGSPSEGVRYLIISGGSGTDWAGQDNKITQYVNDSWVFYTPVESWFVWIKDENKLYRFNGTFWIEFGGITASEWNQNGFENITDSTLTWTDSTPDRTLSIQPTTISFNYWIAGIKYTSTGDTVQITDVEGVHYIYYDGDTLTAIANPSFINRISIIENKALVSIIYWNATDKEGIYIGEERHSKSMSPFTHSYLHFTEGLRYIDGLGLNTLAVDQNGDDAEDAQFGVDTGDVADEDLFLSISSITSTVGLPIYYMTGATPTWNKVINTGYSVIKTGIGGEDRLAYNQYTGGAWQLTEVNNLQFVLCHIFATTEKDKPMIAIVGQNTYITATLARTAAKTEIKELILNDILFPEIRPIATVIFQTKDGYNNAMKARVISTDEGDDYIDWRSEFISRVAISTNNHNALTGLQGGAVSEYYHLTNSQYTDLHNHTNKVELDLVTDGDHDVRVDNPHLVDKIDVSLGNVTNDAQLKRAAGDINTFDEKTSPHDNDILLLEDSEDNNNKKKSKLTNILKLIANKIDDFTIKYVSDKLKIADRIELNIMLNAFDIAVENSIVEHGMIDGMKDVFEDESGIDTGASANEDYDTVNDLYEPTVVAGLELDYMEYASDGAAQAAYVSSDITEEYGSDITSGQTYNASSDGFGAASQAFDDNTGTSWNTSGGEIVDEWVSVQWGSGKIIKKLRLYSYNHDSQAKQCKLEGSNNGSDWTKISANGWDGTVCSQNNTDEWINNKVDDWGWITFNNSTSYTYYRVWAHDNWGWSDLLIKEIEMMESDGIPRLQCYSESSIKNQGSYSLKAIAQQTGSLNDTLTKSGLSIDLTDKDTLKFWAYASRTGTNLQLQIHDSGGTTSTKDILISSATTWTEITWDISGISNANKDDIDSIIIKIINADSANTFYIDNFYAPGLTNNMTLISNSFTAEVAPEDARIVLFEEDVDSITENTDIKAYVSRDGGSTYALVTLVDKGDYQSGKRILTGTVDLTQSGIGSGTNMEYKIETLNNKSLKLHGVGLHWD